MTEREAMQVVGFLKITAIEKVLYDDQKTEYKKILKYQKEGFIKAFSTILSPEILEDVLLGFDFLDYDDEDVL